MKWYTNILAVLLILAPFVLGYSNVPGALWAGIILGAATLILGFMEQYRWATVAGVLAFISPWILGFSGVPAALWTSLILGALIAIPDGIKGFGSATGAAHA